MQTIMEEMGSDLAPEFLQYIQDMGVEGANVLSNMVDSLDSEEGREKIKQMSDEYVEAMDMSESIAEMGALNKTAYEMVLMTQAGILIRTPVDAIRLTGRAAQGVIVMRFKEEGDQVISLLWPTGRTKKKKEPHQEA